MSPSHSQPCRWRRAALAAAVLACALAPAGGNELRNTRIVEDLDKVERSRLEALSAFSIPALESARDALAPDKVRARTAEILALGNLSIGARPQGADGRSPVHRYLEQTFAALAPHGVELLGHLEAEVLAPVPARSEPSRIECGGESLTLYPVYPNGPMPSLAPAEGLHGPLVDARSGSWEEIEGLPLEGAVALLDFGGAANMMRLFSFGALAVVVVEDERVALTAAEHLLSMTPYPLPRYYADAETGRRLRAMLEDGGAPQVSVHGGHLYEERATRTYFAWLPPTVPHALTLDGPTILRLAAAAVGTTADELQALNPGAVGGFEAGDVIVLPGGDDRLSVSVKTLVGLAAKYYGVEETAIAVEPGPRGSGAVAGARLVLPNQPGGLAVTIPVDSLSVVPDAPHGARVASNLALGLAMLEDLARRTDVPRRTGLLFIFTDGDTLGGVASRTAAEYFLIERGLWSQTSEGTGKTRLELYREASAFFGGDLAEIPRDTAYWLNNEWFIGALEEARISLAEDRIEIILERNELAKDADPARRAEVGARLAAIEAEIALIRDFKLSTVEKLGVSTSERLALLRRNDADDATRALLERLQVDPAALEARFRAELAEEEKLLGKDQNNRAVAARVLERLGTVRDGGTHFRWNFHFDFSGASGSVKIIGGDVVDGRLDRAVSTPAERIRVVSSRMRLLAAYAALRGNWDNAFPFVSETDRAEFPLEREKQPAVYDRFWMPSGLLTLPLGTARDRYATVDTPADTLEAVDFDNLGRVGPVVLTLLRGTLENPVDSTASGSVSLPIYCRVEGAVNRFNIRSGIDANDPVGGATVFYPAVGSGGARPNMHLYRGYRRGVVLQSRLNGRYTVPLEDYSLNPKDPRVFAYVLDPDLAVFTRLANEGQVGTQKQSAKFRYRQNETTEKRIVVSDLHPLVIFPGSSPYDYSNLAGNQYNRIELEIQDAVLDGRPRNFAVDNPNVDFSEIGPDAFTLYLEPGRRVRAHIQSGLNFPFILAGPVDEEGEGEGIPVGVESGRREALTLPFTPLHIAASMHALADYRQRIYTRFGIRSRLLEEALARSEVKLEVARAAAAEYRWQEATGAARESWGTMVKNFPKLLNLGRQAIFSVILLMGFLLPVAYFMERLTIGSRSIVGRLGGTTLIFAAATLFLAGFHPAFRIALSPFIVVIAFTMILMSVIVLGLSYQRFEVLLRRSRIESGEVESETISLFSNLATAFSLGISNLKKRAFRTVLTSFTVTVLTFSIVAFVSVREGNQLVPVGIEADRSVEGQTVEPVPPGQEGILFRTSQWSKLDASRVESLEAEFGSDLPMARRAWYIEVEGGNQADREGVNQIPVRHQGKSAVVTGIMSFEPAETVVSDFPDAVEAGRWFRPGDRLTMILPDTAAERLGISAADLVDDSGAPLPAEALPVVGMRGRDWKVTGILDTARADRLRDVNGKSFAMVDYLKSGFSPNVSSEIEKEGTSYHLSWERLVIVPYAVRESLLAENRSVRLRFPEGFDTATFFNDFGLRSKETLFAYVDGGFSMLSSREKVNFSGVTKVILPVLLCVLIVMNTMLGTVEERHGEVKMLGAIGLSPRQIAFLLLSEATVYSLIGLILGTFGGLGFANLIRFANSQGYELLGALSFNFTSLIASGLAVLTGIIVLLATLIPARKAAALAAPSGMARWELPEPEGDGRIVFHLPFTLSRSNAVGMLAFLRRFLLNHADLTSEDFNCRNVRLRSHAENEGRDAIDLQGDVWLAPYDLDVAQHLTIRIEDAGGDEVFGVTLLLERRSGSLDAWTRVNYRFIDLIRLQFLLWRNLAKKQKGGFVEQGVALARESIEAPAD